MASPASAAALINQPEVANRPIADNSVTAPRNSAKFHCPRRLRSRVRRRMGCSDIGSLPALLRLAERHHPVSPVQSLQIVADQQQCAPLTQALQ